MAASFAAVIRAEGGLKEEKQKKEQQGGENQTEIAQAPPEHIVDISVHLTVPFAGDAGAANDSYSSTSSSSYGSGSGSSASPETLLSTVVFIHGESYDWNSGNPYDGSELAAHGNVIVVTINFRLGIFGFLKTGGKESAQGNFGLMDLVAGLHWLKENLPAFGGNPQSITLLGYGTGAVLANILAVSPVASGGSTSSSFYYSYRLYYILNYFLSFTQISYNALCSSAALLSPLGPYRRIRSS